MGILGEDALRDRYDRLSEGSSLIDEDAAYERLREALDEETMRKTPISLPSTMPARSTEHAAKTARFGKT